MRIKKLYLSGKLGASLIGKEVIGNNYVEVIVLEKFEGSCGVESREYGVSGALKQQFADYESIRFIINAKDGRRPRCSH